MAQFKVWNDNKHPYREDFRGQKIHIPAGEFILMEESEAKDFKGSYAPIQVDGDGKPLPESYKRIRLEKVTAAVKAPEAPKAPEHQCIACGYKAASKADLEEHENANHIEQMVDEEEQKKRRKKVSA